MRKLIINSRGARNFKLNLSKKKLIILLSGIFIYWLIMTGTTYAYLYVSGVDNSITGNLGQAGIDLDVDRVVPVNDMPLVPLLDAALGNAIAGNGGISSCIDINNNLSCEVYKITIHNPSTTNMRLTADITLVASGENSNYDNLKWELLDSPTKRKTIYTTNDMNTSILDKNFYLETGSTNIYYIAVWISENGRNQLQTDTGTYGGIVDVRTSHGEGVTATFGEFDDDYCINNGITSLGDCILISEKYSETVNDAKTYIASKEADFTKTAPVITYTESVEKNVTGSEVVIATNKLHISENYIFNADTGEYHLSNPNLVTMIDAVSNNDKIYYVCNDVTHTYCTTMYVIYNVNVLESGGITTYKATNVDRYTQVLETQNISGKGLYMAEDDYGDSYYFRGVVENNYLSFAGFIWRIVRMNGDGSIRLIYSGTSSNDTGSKVTIGVSPFNNDLSDPAYVGYKYGLTKSLQHTTNNNLEYHNLSATSIYYFGDNYVADDNTKKLTISGNVVSGTLKEIWGNGSNNYKYTCFSTTATGTCTNLIEIRSYYDETTVFVNYHSYLSESYESTYTDEYNSVIKNVIDNWYKTNIENKGYTDYVSDNLFCNDRSINSGDGFSINLSTTYGGFYRNYSNKSPSFRCLRQVDQFTVKNNNVIGNGELIYPVGLLTADEAVYAGGKYNSLNSSFYLFSGGGFWLMTPMHFFTGHAAAINWFVNSDGRLVDAWVWNQIHVRPVINLKANTEIISGNGTKNAPYVVKTS